MKSLGEVPGLVAPLEPFAATRRPDCGRAGAGVFDFETVARGFGRTGAAPWRRVPGATAIKCRETRSHSAAE